MLLFGWLFLNNANFIDIAATINNAESNSEISEINSFTNIDELKQFSISKVNQMKSNREKDSENAITRSILILALIFVQIILYSTKGNFPRSKTLDF